MKNQVFDWSRFVATLRKELIENWRIIMFSLVGIYGLSVMLMILGNLVTGGHMEDSTLALLPFNVMFMVGSFSAIIFASLSFRSLTTKTGRVNLLSSPSSTFEKYAVNVTVYVLGFFVAFPLCLQLADLTRIVFLLPWKSETFLVPGPINFLLTVHNFAQTQELLSEQGKSLLELSIWVSLLASPGLYFLGSVMWPRLSFLKTFAAVYAIEFVVFLIILISFLTFGNVLDGLEWIANRLTETSALIGLAAFAFVQLVVYWSLSWWLWKRKDVISLKWWS